MFDTRFLEDQHRKRPQLEQDLLTVLALRDAQVSRTEWLEMANDVGLRSGSRQVSNQMLGEYCKHFVQEGAIVVRQVSAKRVVYSIPTAETFAYLKSAASAKRLRALAHPSLGLSESNSRLRTSYSSRQAAQAALLRIGLVEGDDALVAEALERRTRYLSGKRDRLELTEWLLQTLGDTPDEAWLARLPADILKAYADAKLDDAVTRLRIVAPSVLSTLPKSHMGAARYHALRNDETRALSFAPLKSRSVIQMLSAFAQGEVSLAADAGSAAIAAMRKRKYQQLKGTDGVVHALICLATGHRRATDWEHLKSAVLHARDAKVGQADAYDALRFAQQKLCGANTKYVVPALNGITQYRVNEFTRAAWSTILVLALVHGLYGAPNKHILELARTWKERASDGGFGGIAREFEAAIDRMVHKRANDDTIAGQLRVKPAWEFSLDALALIASEEKTDSKTEVSSFREHIRWMLRFDTKSQMAMITPRLIRSKRMVKGKELALSKLLDGSIKELSAADREVLTYVKKRVHIGRSASYDLTAAALPGLIDHPHVCRHDGSSLKVVRGDVRLSVDTKGKQLRLSILPAELLSAPIAFEESSGGIVVYERDASLTRIVVAINGRALSIPSSESERLSHILSGLSSMVSVSANADVEVAGEELAPDPRPLVRLSWDGDSLSAQLVVAPLGMEGPHLAAGKGSELLAATVGGRAVRTKRALRAEKSHKRALVDKCPSLSMMSDDIGALRFGLEDALQLLLELEDAADGVVVAWPDGQKLRAPIRAGVREMHVRVAESPDWLDLDVSVQVDEESVLSFRDLLAARQGRFIALDNGRFAALSEELQRRLDAFEGIGKKKGSGVSASRATLGFIGQLAEGAELSLDAGVAERHANISRALAISPRVPRVFGAELRDYQIDGFRWLARLAEAGLGACLADDMGLGKTIQSLAVLVLRRKKGPALVVAPSSVATNWASEVHRFAPSLRVQLLADAEREKAIEALKPGNVLVCSYGLLQRETERLAKVAFDTVVFDEAHLLKNAGTKRSKAARNLNAHFRLSLSGTPIENHLGELWSLMECTVPGLLGSKKRFEERFATPIVNGDRERSAQLRALLRPFMLRRTKAQVLGELPPRTEVTIRVSPNADERAFYEALRQKAIEHLVHEENEGDGRLHLLAQITRLRQAAVDPRLVDKAGPAGSKIDTLMDRIESLRAEGHRALIFTQFLGSMARIHSRLDAASIPYQSLDGSTSSAERKKRIDAFQDGDGDVFVISLKAGGVGVNLTGADYVIHMDPWWNPAVEDQATSRSHRLGQERPVTVYRLISEGTIEEKILSLHQSKRALADDLLSGIDKAKKLDLEQIRMLIAAD